LSSPAVDLLSHIQHVIQTAVRPALQEDGGDVVLVGYENGVVSIQLVGACHGCPHAQQTLQMHIEKTIRHYVPEVQSVQAVLD
jgi:Fe-S cluster biogenesis protein NfuA